MATLSVLTDRPNTEVNGSISAPQAQSNLVIQDSASNVTNYIRQGSDLIVQMESGKSYLIRNFAINGADFHNLIFSQGSVNTLVDLSGAFISVPAGILPAGAITLEVLGAGTSTGVLLGILGTAVAVGGVGAALATGGGGDTTAPHKLSAIKVRDDVENLTGELQSGDLTNDNRPTFSGTDGEAGARVELRDRSGVVLATTTVAGDGTWSLTPSDSLSEGFNKLSLVQIDSAGNEGEAVEFDIIVDSVAPSAPSAIATYIDDVGLPTPASTASVTNDVKPSLNIVKLVEGSPALYVDGVRVESIYDAAAGTLTPVQALADGQHKFTWTITDSAGNESKQSSAFLLAVDSTPPLQTIVINSIVDDAGSLQGSISSGSTTDDGSPTLSGILSARLGRNEKLEVLRDGVVIGTAIVKGTDWVFSDTGLADGSHNYTLRIVDQAGNVSETSNSYNILLDTRVPSAIATIVAAKDTFGAIQGNVPNGGFTNDAGPELIGNLSSPLGSGEYLEILRDGVSLGQAVVEGTSWTFSDTDLVYGATYSYSVRVVDRAGNIGSLSNTYTISIDLVGTVSLISDDQGTITGSIASGATTDDTSPVLSGTLTDTLPTGGALEVLRNGVVIGTATVTGTNWTYADTGLLDGTSYSYTVRVRDAAGNAGTASAAHTIIIDTSVPTAAISSITDDVSRNTGTIASGGMTNDASPALAGTLSAALGSGDIVQVLRDGTVIGNATVTGTNWTYADTGVTDGAHSYTVKVVDLAGNSSTTAAYAITVDTTAPGTPTIKTISNDYGTAGDFTTYANSVVVTGEAEAGITVEILLGSTVVGTATADSTGIWQSGNIDISSIAIGSSGTLKVRAVDTAGNASADVTQTVTKYETTISASTLAPTQGFVIQGDTAGDNFGRSVSLAGDVNGDGIADMIVGAPYGDDGGTTAGEAYIIFGRSNGNFGTLTGGRNVLDVTNLLPTQGFIIQGDTTSDQLGFGVSRAGDINGDGIEDLVAGADNGGDGGAGAGEAYIIFGRSNSNFGTLSGTRNVVDVTNLVPTQGFIVQGDLAYDNLGRSMSPIGDVNGDGYNDLIIGAEAADTGGTSSGNAYVIFGRSNGSFGTLTSGRNVVDTSTLGSTQGFIIQGDTDYDYFGYSVSGAGDINGDSIADIIVSTYSGDDGGSSAVEAYVIFGRTNSNFGTSSGGRNVLDTTNLAPTQGFIIQGDTANDYFGRSVSSLGDVNGDGIADLIVGADGGSDGGSGAGEAYVVFGRSNSNFGTLTGGRNVLDTTTLASTQGFIIQGDTASDSLGFSVSGAGDFNGDGYTDLLAGAYNAKTGGVAYGSAYIIFGRSDGSYGTPTGGRQVLDITNLGDQGIKIKGDAADDSLGFSVSGGRDINGDGYADVIVGAFKGDDGGVDAGEAYVIYGNAAFTSVVTVGTSAANHLSGSDSADTITGNGGADVLLGFGGNDVINVSDTTFRRIDGGAGDDKLLLAGADLDLNFKSLAADVVTNIETIDISGTGDNSITLTMQDVLDMSSTTDRLVIDGNDGDWVVAEGFTDSGNDGTIGAKTYNIFTNGGATLWINKNIASVLDANAPTTKGTITAFIDDVETTTGSIANGGLTNDNTPALSGTLSAALGGGDVVEVLRDGTVVGTATVAGSNWSYNDTGAADGAHTYRVQVRNGDGKTGALSKAYTVTVDTSVPTATISSITDDVVRNTGTIASGGMTNDTSPALAGTLSAALGSGDVVQVLRDGAVIGNASVTGTNWTYADTGVTDGAHSYTVKVVDLAGNSSTTAAYTITVDATAPGTPTIKTISSDMGTLGDFTTYATSVVATGEAEAGATVEILLGSTVVGTVTADSTGIWQSGNIDISAIAVGSTGTLKARAIDTAGNVSADATQLITKSSSVLDTTSLAPTQGFIIQGVAGDQLGSSVTMQDMNGDYIPDLIVGANGAPARTYVVFGKVGTNFGTLTSGRNVVNVASLAPTVGFVIQGTSDSSLGMSVAALGDVNGDGIKDIVIGAPYADAAATNSGEAFVIYGRSNSNFGTLTSGRNVMDMATLAPTQGFVISKNYTDYLTGTSVSSAGDINGDGVADIAVSMPGASDHGLSRGTVTIIFGRSNSNYGSLVNGRNVLDVATPQPTVGFRIIGDTDNDKMGNFVSAAGDVNGDGIGDLIVGAQYGDDGGTDAGEAYVVFGRTNNGFGGPDINGTNNIFLNSLAPTQGFVIQGDLASDYLGGFVSSAGDINGDGRTDLFVGARNGDLGGSNSGQIYVIYGRSNSNFGTQVGARNVIDTTSLAPTQGFIIQGDTASDTLTFATSAGDFNGDGYKDLLLGADGNAGGGTNAGAAYLIYGRADGTYGTLVGGKQILDLTNLGSAGFVIQGDTAQDRFGQRIMGGMDVNSDGYSDIIVGASGGSDGGGYAGEAYVIYGSPTYRPNITAVGTSAANHLSGSDSADTITGNGGADVLLGFGGNDVISVSDTTFRRIDGGAGDDTLRLNGSNLHLDFTNLASDVVTNIEGIDLSATGSTNKVTLTMQDVLDMSSTTDILKIDGKAGDSVFATGFTDSGVDQTASGTTYDVYTNGGATLWIDKEINTVVVI
ncbi:MAG: FG-GAP repeat protein [Rhizobiaceae bacterium]|nr:FG-GAP repeat protein [Rhizobiaceae bacterium]